MFLDVSVLVGLAVLTVMAGLGVRRRLRDRTRALRPRLTNQDVRRIVETGSLAVDDDPLDLEEVREAEERFWSETWDEAEEV